MKTVLITGVAGFIGSNLAAKLLELGHKVVGVDNLSQGTLRNIEPFKTNRSFEFHEVDVRDQEKLAPLIDRVDTVVHLAAYKIPRYSDATDTLLINAHGTKSVLEAATKSRRHVIFASTSDAYGRNPDIPFHENSDLWMGPSNVRRWAYALSKIYDEHLGFAYQEEKKLPITIVRFFGGYGPNQNLTWWGGPQSVFINAALKDLEMEIHGDGQQTRSFTYISDHVDGLVRCVERPEAVGQVFNLGNTYEITILGLAEMIWKLAGKGDPKIKMISYRTFGKYDDVRRRVPDVSKANRLLGFVPQIDLESGLKRTIQWQKSVTE